MFTAHSFCGRVAPRVLRRGPSAYCQLVLSAGQPSALSAATCAESSLFAIALGKVELVAVGIEEAVGYG